jgi:broad specificity phosphatase PhoE
MRRKPSAHLSQEGITLARRVGEHSPDYDYVFSSPLPRAIETALVMGFEVNEIIEGLGNISDDMTKGIKWPNSFSGVMRIVSGNEICTGFAYKQAALWSGLAAKMADGQHALAITHGGVIELGAVASAPMRDHTEWGDAIGYCEGVRIQYEGSTVINVTPLRVPDDCRLIDN